MDDRLFAELVESIHQAGQYQRGEGQPSRITEFPDPDVKAIREAARLSQAQFALLIGVKPG